MTKTTRRSINTALLATLLTAGLPVHAQAREDRSERPQIAPGSWSFFFEVVRPFVGYWLGITTTDSPAIDSELRIGPRASTDRSPTQDPDG